MGSLNIEAGEGRPPLHVSSKKHHARAIGKSKESVTVSLDSVTYAFRDAMAEHGILTNDTLIADGILRRFHIEGHARGTLNGAYVLHFDARPAGWFEDHKTGFEQTWSLCRGHGRLSAADMAAIEVSRRRRAEEQRAGYEIAAIKARRIYNESEQCCGHAYLKYKHVPSCRGLHVTDDGTLLVPMFDGNGKLWSIQRIYQDGELFHKRFLAGGKVSGMFFTIQGSDTIGICEGLATGLSIRKETGHTIYVAFSAGNLKAVSKAVRTRHPHARVIFFADNDLKTEGNPGVKKADEAARAIHADLAIPPINGDWNDFLEGGSRGRDS